MSASKILTRKNRAMGGLTRRGRRHPARLRRSITEGTPQPPLTMQTPLGTFRQPPGERGSVTNPLGPRFRRRAHWVPADERTAAAVAKVKR